MSRRHRWPALAALALAGIAPLSAQSAATPDFAPPRNPARELHIAHVQYLAQAGDPLRALAAWHGLPESTRDDADNTGLKLALAGQLADYGLLEKTRERISRQRGPGVGLARRNAIHMTLAKAWLARGQYDRAQRQLDAIYGEKQGSPAERQRVTLKARTLLAQGQYDKTIKLLRRYRDRYPKAPHNPFNQYNLGVALLRSGQQEIGAGALNELGTGKADSALRKALRDKANLVLAFAYLETGQGGTARALFQRIRLNGPFSDKALLGLGWAELAPDGERQTLATSKPIRCIEDPARLLRNSALPVLRRIPRKACGKPKRFVSHDKFDTVAGGKTQDARYQRALAPWLVLAKRDPSHSSVQEALVASAHAYAALGAAGKAADAYGHAVDSLDTQATQLDAIMQQLANPGVQSSALPPGVAPDLAWFAQRWGLPGDHDMPFLADTIASTRFHRGARMLQDLIALRDVLATNAGDSSDLQATLNGRRTALLRSGLRIPRPLRDQQQRLDVARRHLQSMRGQVDDSIGQTGAYLRKLALAGARDYRKRLLAYLTTARLGRAKHAQAGTGESQ